jgi:hypothetical protein
MGPQLEKYLEKYMETERSIHFACRVLLGVVALSITLGVGWTSAQSVPATARDSETGPAPVSPAAVSGSEPSPDRAPAYCSPCLYYSGDFDPFGPAPNGLANENDLIVSPAQIFTPFTVPNDHTWYVTGLFINTLTTKAVSGGTAGTHQPKKAGWSIWAKTSAGYAGGVLFAGANHAYFVPTGRTGFGYTEYTASVLPSTPVWLGPGTYFLNILPQCVNTLKCAGQRFFESDVEDASPAHHYGPANLIDQSFFNSGFFASNYTSATSTCGAGAGCDLFSFGIVGTCTVNSTGGPCPF